MEVVKCPVCGSEKCQEVKSDQYICLACDNIFHLHNLSKEFKQTEKHIDRVYNDLKDTIINNTGLGDGLDSAFRSAVSLAERGEYKDAQEIFMDISKKYAWSYKGWYGQFLVEKGKKNFFSEELYSLIIKVMASEDITHEVKQELDDYLIEMKRFHLSDIKNKIAGCENKIEEMELGYQNLKKTDEDKELRKKLEKTRTKKIIFKVTSIVIIVVLVLLVIFAIGSWIINSNGIWIVIKPVILIGIAMGIYKLWDEDILINDIILFLVVDVGSLFPDYESEEERIMIEREAYYEQLKNSEIDLLETKNRMKELQDISQKCEEINVSQVEEYRDLVKKLKTFETEKKGGVQVQIEEFYGDKVMAIKTIHEIMKFDLGKSKKMVDNLPSIIAEDITIDKAKKIQNKLEKEGFIVNIL